MKRLMGIDFGSKRVGVASTDESGTFSLPRLVLSNDDELLKSIMDLIEEWKIEMVVIGESRKYNGEENEIMKEARHFGDELEEKGVRVVYQPEVLTSSEAKQLQGDIALLDASAAAIILKSYIDTHAHH